MAKLSQNLHKTMETLGEDRWLEKKNKNDDAYKSRRIT